MSKVLVVYAGGTILGRRLPSGAILAGRLSAEVRAEIVKRNPAHELAFVQVVEKLSEDFHPRDWVQIVKAMKSAFDQLNPSGIVLVHGTYTMAYTSAALSFMVTTCPCPIVVTGAISPLEEDETGHSTISAAIDLAASPGALKEVVVLFPSRGDEVQQFTGPVRRSASQTPESADVLCVYRGTRVRKLHSERPDCFRSINADPLGHFHPSEISRVLTEPSGSGAPFEIEANVDDRVGLVKVFPGCTPQTLLDLGRGNRALVIEGYADGIVPASDGYDLSDAIRQLKNMGCLTFATSQVFGSATLRQYAGGERLRNAGLTPLGDMTTEAAVTKLMWLLGRSGAQEDIESLMTTSLRGEISVNSIEGVELA